MAINQYVVVHLKAFGIQENPVVSFLFSQYPLVLRFCVCVPRDEMLNVFHSFRIDENISFSFSSDPTHSTIATTVDSIADAVTHARFVGSDQASDGVVLMKVVQVLRTLILSPEGSALTDESVCEVMLSCIRIVFEPRLNELLRRTAEQVLKDIVLLLFMRLPQFAEERHTHGLIRKLKMMSSGGGMETSGKRRRSSKSLTKTTSQSTSKPISANATKNLLTATPAIRCPEPGEVNTPKATLTSVDNDTATPNQALLNVQKPILATTPSTPHVGNIVDMQGKFMQTPHPDGSDNCGPSTSSDSKSDNNDGASNSNSADGTIEENFENDADVEDEPTVDNENSAKPTTHDVVVDNREENASTSLDANPIAKGEDFVNSMGVRFTPQTENGAFLSKFLFSTFPFVVYFKPSAIKLNCLIHD